MLSISKIQNQYAMAIKHRCLIQALHLFPDNKLISNGSLAQSVSQKIFEDISPYSDIDADQFEILFNSICSDERSINIISKYFLLESLYYSQLGQSKSESENAFEKAKKYVSSVSALSAEDLKDLSQSINQETKRLDVEIKALTSEKIDEELDRIISPTTIKPYHWFFLVSLLSTIILTVGFVYNWVFFAQLGVNIEDFFLLTDYITTSIVTIVWLLFYATIGVAWIFRARRRGLKEIIIDQQFEIIEKKKDFLDYFFLFIYLSSLLFVGIDFLHNHNFIQLKGEIDQYTSNLVLHVVVVMTLTYVLFRLSIWKFVKNSSEVTLFVLVLLIIFPLLWLSAKNDAASVQDESYIGQYSFELTEPYRKFEDNEFISANSHYIFLWSAKNKNVNIVPKMAVVSLSAKSGITH